jgi:SAM-dependent methyltransferase
MAQHLEPTLPLLSLAVREAGGRSARRAIDAHQALEGWSRWVPLALQEHTPLLGRHPHFHQPLESSLVATNWGLQRLRALARSGNAMQAAARKLLGELNGIAEEAAERAKLLPRLRLRIAPPLNALQVQALLRLELAVGKSVRGMRILEVGPDQGGLFRLLIHAGADVTGLDLHPAFVHPRLLQGDFVTTSLPDDFDVVIATGVFEHGSSEGKGEGDPRNLGVELLKKLRARLRPGGRVVLENIGLPIPFSPDQAEAAGFQVVRQVVPCVNVALGARGCLLRLRPRA